MRDYLRRIPQWERKVCTMRAKSYKGTHFLILILVHEEGRENDGVIA